MSKMRKNVRSRRNKRKNMKSNNKKTLKRTTLKRSNKRSSNSRSRNSRSVIRKMRGGGEREDIMKAILEHYNVKDFKNVVIGNSVNDLGLFPDTFPFKDQTIYINIEKNRDEKNMNFGYDKTTKHLLDLTPQLS